MSEGEAKRRWNPTGEQVRILERVYREGTHRPTTMEIHHITDLLSRHGSVQGINVFYWFKNRKAREKRSTRNMHASALTVKWGGLELNSGGSGCDHRQFLSTTRQEVVVGVEVNGCVLPGRKEEKPLQTLQLFPPCEK
ncbi:hypothetical protein SUGI_0512120 [Cryptomeria japonica]|uniref:WUSCHEL-related homeobox 5 n=1 Tax=Cryptomeria japonica TaxID=3369 RepID=UPI002408DADC|nr:WUSCHEL-related homeobox 5 [Cryptomeria japonica]GLJ26501.1 hypothetical protein SUGI_0512120 [Cryptomeria japonica]